MTEQEVRSQAAIAELTNQRNAALDRCVQLSADLAVANAALNTADFLKARLAELEKPQEVPLTQ